MQWFYLQKLVVRQLQPDYDEDSEISEELRAKDMSLVELWVLADKLCICRLQNYVLKVMEDINVKSNSVNTTTLHYIYENTAADSPLRRYSVVNCATMATAALREKPDYLPHQMLLDFSRFLLDRHGRIEEETLDISDYFVKED